MVHFKPQLDTRIQNENTDAQVYIMKKNVFDSELLFRIIQNLAVLTLKYFPAKSCTPMMAKMSQKMRQTRSTLNMLGIACTKALTTT